MHKFKFSMEFVTQLWNTDVRKNDTISSRLHLIVVSGSNVLTSRKKNVERHLSQAFNGVRSVARTAADVFGNVLKEALSLSVSRTRDPTRWVDDSSLEIRSPFVATKSLQNKSVCDVKLKSNLTHGDGTHDLRATGREPPIGDLIRIATELANISVHPFKSLSSIVDSNVGDPAGSLQSRAVQNPKDIELFPMSANHI